MCIILTDINSVFSHHNPMRYTEQAALLSTHADHTQVFMVWPFDSHYCWCQLFPALPHSRRNALLALSGWV